jgi:hypothetical protein
MLSKKVLSATTGFADVRLRNGENLRFEIVGSPNQNINIFLADSSNNRQPFAKFNIYCDDWNQAKLIAKYKTDHPDDQLNQTVDSIEENDVYLYDLR